VCLAHWAEHNLPLVITRQPAPSTAGIIALGLPAPARWSRRRVALNVPLADVAGFDEFPQPRAVIDLMPEAARGDWRGLCHELETLGAVARVHGSHGWQQLTGLDYLHAASDIDLWIAVRDGDQADEAAKALLRFTAASPRLDGELVFDNGNAVAWREWVAWRAGSTRAVLIKRIDGCSLSSSPLVAQARDVEATL
jgi:phosphoribosyl-dephospho-CoA transferase